MSTFKDNLNSAFKALRKDGYFARQNFMCCQSCACAAIPDDKAKAYAFYHAQDASSLREADGLRHTRRFKPEDVGVYLAWGGDGQQIVRRMKEAGLQVEWDGTSSQRIWVCETLPTPAQDEYVSQLETMLAR